MTVMTHVSLLTVTCHATKYEWMNLNESRLESSALSTVGER
jgi:hypothetical protein